MKTKIGIAIGALLLIGIWIYVALSVWKLGVREIIAGVAAIVALAGLLMKAFASKTEAKTEVHGDGNVIGNGNIVGNNNTNNVVGNSNTVNYERSKDGSQREQ
jgi:high-affinity Fe2+/Pb2+ permease